jgi:hypothetical protein
MTIFFELFNSIHKFLNKVLEIILVSSLYFPLLSQFHYPSLLNDIQVEILMLGRQTKMDINKFEFIYLSIMDEFHPIIYLFNPNLK